MKLIEDQTPIWRYECNDGIVMVYSMGDEVTPERVLYLLEMAKQNLLKNQVCSTF